MERETRCASARIAILAEVWRKALGVEVGDPSASAEAGVVVDEAPATASPGPSD